jgi:class 3 adenylate cyclase
MNCPSCQAHNSDDRRFCADCGAPLAAPCGDCGFENQPGARFCGGCGRALGTAAPTAEPKAAAETAGGERRQVTVLFADLVGFTALSSSLDAEDLHDLMERFFACVDGIVEGYGGTVDKHIGDAVMAVFGAPIAHGDDPLRALRAAVDIHGAVANLGEDCGRKLAVHVGVASGEVLAGGLGGESRRDYTVLGDSVNLASRLDEMAKAGETLISEAVYQATSDKAKCEALGEVQVKGLGEAVRVWRLLALREQAPARHLSPFIGRRVELAQLAGVLDACRESGSGQVVYLRGDAGIGKSRLVEELTALAEARGYSSHKGLVLDFGMGRGRDAIRALVMSFLGLPMACDPGARQAAADEAVAAGSVDTDKRAFLNDLLDLEQPSELRTIYDAMDYETRNQGKRATVVSLLESAGRSRPVLLTVEDVHWADPMTLSHLAALASAGRECPAVLAITTRIEGDPLDGAWRTEIQGGALMTIDLAPLRREEAEGLADALINTKGALVEHCIERAGGNPLFLEQLLRNAQESGGDEVPGTIQSLVLSRMDRLSPADKAALQAASVIGQRFSLIDRTG